VEVKLRDWGLELIEVSDNGSGIAPKNYQVRTWLQTRKREREAEGKREEGWATV